MNFRVGIGYDIHRFGAGRKLYLGGVLIPGWRGLVGHSDADVLLHAVCDALLGAAGKGDIGVRFPDTRKEYKGISSITFLQTVAGILRRDGFRVGNIDATLILEAPKISPYRQKMARVIARALGIGKERISVKATTQEGVGAIGRGEAAAAYAVALIERK